MTTNTFETNPRAVVGSNQAPDHARIVTEQMERDYAELNTSVSALLDEARDKATDVTNDAEALDLGALIKRMADADKRAEAFRVAEVEPHLRAKNAVDQFFFAIRDKLGRRNKNDRSTKPGAIDILQGRVNAYLERKRIEEDARRRREAEEAARIAREAQERAVREAREAEEARLAAERARKPENVAARTQEALQAEEAAAASNVEAALAAERAQEAHIGTLAKPADMVRTRGDNGVLLTQARESYAIVLDRTKLDWSKIAPFFTDAEVEKALRGWARVTNHAQQMDGAEVGFRRKGVTR